jgi:hypothetical protein
MSFIAAAIIGGGAALAGGAIAASGAKGAAKTQSKAALQAADIANQQWQTTNQQESPFRNAGYGAQSQLNYLLGIGDPSGGGNQIQAPPGSNPSSGWGPSSGTAGHPTANGGWSMQPTITTNPQSQGAPVMYGQHGPMYAPGGGPASDARTGLGPYADTGNPPPDAGPAYGGAGPGNSGGSSAGGFGSLLSPFTIDTFHQYSPAYQFQLQQGQQGVLNGSASGSGALSGAAQKDLMSFNQNMANTSFNNAFNQYQTQQGNIYSRLAGVANLGQNAAANTGTIGAGLAGSAAQSVSNAGTAAAAGQVGAANAYSSALNNAGSSAALPWLMANAPPPASSPNVVQSGGYGYNLPSDIRLKTDIEKIGERPDGLGVYLFRYIAGGPRRIGLMAQEVLKVIPEAVTRGADGYLMVDYGRV